MSKHLWNIAKKKDSLWVKWVNVHRLKGRSVWEVPVDIKASWGWKKLLELREKVRPHIWSVIGNGKNTEMWHDKWNIGGPLSNVVTRRAVYSAGLQNNEKVANMIVNGQWQWPVEWLDQFPQLSQIEAPRLNDDTEDSVHWLSNKMKVVKFSISRVWKDLRETDVKVPWYDVVWFPQFIPRHAFILWLLVQERLPTQDRLLKWQPTKVMKCALCSKEVDSHQHLFFECKYSASVWDKARMMCKIQTGSNSWKTVMEELMQMPNKRNIWLILRKIVFAAVTYFIWIERNSRLFKDVKRPWEILWKEIEETVKLKISGLKVADSRNVNEVYDLWGITGKLQKTVNAELL